MRDHGNRRVLIVDDSPAFTDALSRLLVAEGFAVDVVHDAVQHTALDAERAGVDVQVEIGADLPPLVGDGPSPAAALDTLRCQS